MRRVLGAFLATIAGKDSFIETTQHTEIFTGRIHECFRS